MRDTAIRGVRLAAAASLALVVAAGAAACGSAAPAAPTARVERGQVSTKVSASGALAPVSSQNLGFANAAQLVELDVKVGDTVRAGQVLAREDPFSYQQLLKPAAGPAEPAAGHPGPARPRPPPSAVTTTAFRPGEQGPGCHQEQRRRGARARPERGVPRAADPPTSTRRQGRPRRARSSRSDHVHTAWCRRRTPVQPTERRSPRRSRPCSRRRPATTRPGTTP